ncbi:glycosyltransferase [Azospirillum sp. A39]|uniref:glycosyltransferase n=1 Tax=Azospirillum sp. A39 TaxID=3462279 RepID=UPI004046308E
MIPRIIHQLWKGPDVPDRFRAFQDGWRRHHPDWDYRLWTDADIAAFVAGAFPDLLGVFEGYAQPICRADLARYLILKRFGGLYADLDFECLKPVDGLIAGASLAIGLEPESHLALGKAAARGMSKILCPSLIASAPEHGFWDHVLSHVRRHAGEADVLDATGPFLLTRAFDDYRGADPVTLLAPASVYPADKEECWQGRLLDVERWEAVTRDAYALHHWDGTWFRGGAAGAARPQRLRVMLTEGKGPSAVAAGPVGAAPLISCLMVTRDRFAQACLAIECFRRQTYVNRQLVIIDDSRDDRLAAHVAALDDSRILIERSAAPAATLGEARNRAVDRAAGTFVCQWDDDDLYDPLRLELQMAALLGAKARACVLRRWMIWWPGADRLGISGRRVWEGSLLCEKAVLPRYPALRRGEDSPVVEGLMNAVRMVHLDEPWLYLYVVHGRNTFDGEHFDAQWRHAERRWEGERYRAVRAQLAKRLDLDAYPGATEPAGGLWARVLAESTAMLGRAPGNAAARARRAGALLHLDRLEEAEAAFRELRDRHPGETYGLDGLARVSARRKRWLEALERWDDALSAFPDHWHGMLGRGETLLELGRFAEAEAAFAEAARRRPEGAQALTGLAETVARQRDWRRAHVLWCRVLAVTPTAPRAVVGMVAALVELGRLDEADAVVARHAAVLDRADRVLAQALVLQRRQRGTELQALLDANPAVVAGNVTLRNLHFHTLQTRGEADRAAAVLAPPGSTALERDLAGTLAHVHGAQGVTAEARARLLDLWRRHGAGVLTPDLLALLVDSLARADGADAAGAALATVEAMPLTTVRAVRLRLLAVFERLKRGEQGPAEAALRALADDADPRAPFGHWAAALDRLAGQFERLRALYPRFHIDTGWRRPPAEAVVERILEAHAARRPFSLVRLGDGEGNFLPYPAAHADFADGDRAATQCVWWGEARATGPAAGALSADLRAAVRNADVVGVPDLSRLCYGLPIPTAEDPYLSWHDYRGLLVILHHLLRGPGEGELFAPEQLITSCHIHADLSAWGLYERLFDRIRRVALVTCHPSLPDHLARRFGLSVSRVHAIPHESKYGAVFGYGEGEAHFPGVYERLMATLDVGEPGEVVLVAAGFLGKMYCDRIKRRGGIALDIGSIADHWCRFATRSLHFVQRYAAAPEPPHAPAAPRGGSGAADDAVAGVTVLGHFESPVGLGVAGRGTLEALRAAGMPCTPLDLDAPSPPGGAHHPVTVVHTNADFLLSARTWTAGPLAAAATRDGAMIGCWAWESASSFPPPWVEAAAMFDEIWVPSRFTADALARRLPVPVAVVPHAVEPADPALTRRDLGLPETAFVFAFAFDELSGFERKNPLGLVTAFRAAFPEDDGRAMLVIKARTLSDGNRERLRAAIGGRTSILLREGSESRDAALALLARCDAYVSLHRAEGFGLTIAEAMAFGRPVIATAYSGNLDFMAPGCAYPVPYRLVATRTDHGYYPAGTEWAEPDLDEAARLMRAVVRSPQAAAETGRRAAEHIRATLTAQAVGRVARERVEAVVARRLGGRRPADRRDRAAAAAVPPAGAVPSVLVLTPVKNARRHLPAYLAALDRLDHLRDRLSLAFLEGDSDDGSHAYLDGRLEELRTRYRRVELHRHDFGVRLAGVRWDPAVQPLRRATIARARNRLLTGALREEEWVLWIDADVVGFPPDVLRRLLAAGRDIVTPNCVTTPGGPSFDLNSFQFIPGAAESEERHRVAGLIQPPKGVGRRYLDALRGQAMVPLDGVGGTMLLVRGALHREGLVFPAASYRGYIETEGLAMMAKDLGVTCWGLPDVEILHAAA